MFFYGVNNTNFELIQRAYPDLKLIARGSTIRALGDPEKLQALQQLIDALLTEIRLRGPVDSQRVSEILRRKRDGLPAPQVRPTAENVIVHGNNGAVIVAKSAGQQRMVELIEHNDVLFAVGPAGSGKTYTAVALAVRALKVKEVKKIVLVRPAVEAGERLGFLPGDMKEKIDPYLRPLYDALEDMIHPEKLKHYMERNIIEIVPLAFMRGRTLNNAFIICDEAQNATEIQLKMMLTRLGLGSKIIITGDMTQIDLPRSIRSGLIQCTRILKDIKGIGFIALNESDVVRHPIIKHILRAYDHAEKEAEQRGKERRAAEAASAGATAAPSAPEA